MKEANATYVINDVVNLKGDTIFFPVNSKLKFKRKGVLANGVIKGNNTQIEGEPVFDRIRLKGSFQNNEYRTSWCVQESMSEYIEDVMNLSDNSALRVDCDITLADKKRYVNHLTLIGENKTVINSDRFNVIHGGTEISNLKFRWNKPPVVEPADNYDAVVVYHHLLEKDTTVVIKMENIDADGGMYCSFFMRQYKSSIQSMLQTDNRIKNCNFVHFTRGAIWTCGGTGYVTDCKFLNIGYDKTQALWSVTALRLGYDTRSRKSRAKNYCVERNVFKNLVAAYNPDNDGRELHGLLAYGDSIIIKNNIFSILSTSFTKATDTGKDSEILYIKGSYNVIEGNKFENGAGTASDGVVTLKVGSTKGNVVRNNKFFIDNTGGKFIYLGGYGHLIEGNNFVSTYSFRQGNNSFAIYLGNRDNDSIKESVIIRDNTFRFPEENNYMAIYANKWGDLTLTGNRFYNPTKLLKCNNRNGVILVNNNIVTLNRVQGTSVDNFIELSGSESPQAIISNNDITLTNSSSGRLVKGSNYCFFSNSVTLNNSILKTLLQGNETDLKNSNNLISIDNSSKITK